MEPIQKQEHHHVHHVQLLVQQIVLRQRDYVMVVMEDMDILLELAPFVQPEHILEEKEVLVNNV